MVKKLSILLLKAYIGPFIVTFLIAMFIFEMQLIWVYLDDLMGKGLSLGVILQLLLYASARIVNMALPLAILMSSIMAMGALAENNELTAMKGAGISLFRIMRPLIIFSVFLSVASFIFANNIWPIANLKYRTLLFSIIQQRPALNLEEGVFYSGIEGISIRVMRKSNDGTLEDVLIYDHRNKSRGNRTVIRAEKGIMDQTPDKRFLVLTLYNGHSYDEQEEKSKRIPQYPSIHSSFKESIIRLDLSSFAFQTNDEEVFKTSYEMMNIPQLNDAIDSLSIRLDSTKQKLAEVHLTMLHLPATPDSSESKKGEWFFNTLDSRDQQKAIINALESSKRVKANIPRQNDEIKAREKFLIRHKVEWHRKFFLAVVCLVLFFIGAPLGAIIRKGGLGMPTIIALGLFILYQLLTIAGEKMAKSGIVEPYLGMWVSTALLLPLSFWITYKATKEAVLFDRDGLSKVVQKIVRIFKRNRKNENPSVVS